MRCRSAQKPGVLSWMWALERLDRIVPVCDVGVTKGLLHGDELDAQRLATSLRLRELLKPIG